MITRYVIVHPEWGIFVGSSMGGAFWTKMDPVGQDRVVTFGSPDEVVKYLASWKPEAPGGLRAVPVEIDDDEKRATVEQCEAAGLDAWDPGFKLAGGTIHGELASIIEKVERLTMDAAATSDHDYAMRVAAVCRALSNGAARRSVGIKNRLEGTIEHAILFEAASRDAFRRAVAVLDDERWEQWRDEDKVPTPPVKKLVTTGAANDVLQDEDEEPPPKPPWPKLVH